jgi:hypothetical protein
VRPFDQPYSGINVLPEKSEGEPGIDEDFGIFGGESEGPTSQIDTLATVGLRVVRPVVPRKQLTTMGSQCEGGAEMRIAFDCFPEQVERLKDALVLE